MFGRFILRSCLSFSQIPRQNKLNSFQGYIHYTGTKYLRRRIRVWRAPLRTSALRSRCPHPHAFLPNSRIPAPPLATLTLLRSPPSPRSFPSRLDLNGLHSIAVPTARSPAHVHALCSACGNRAARLWCGHQPSTRRARSARVRLRRRPSALSRTVHGWEAAGSWSASENSVVEVHSVR